MMRVASVLLLAVGSAVAAGCGNDSESRAGDRDPVKPPPPVILSSVSLGPQDYPMTVGGYLRLWLRAFDQNRQVVSTTSSTVEFSSSNPAVAEVTEEGDLTALAPGDATISVKLTLSGTGRTATAEFVVVDSIPLQQVELRYDEWSLWAPSPSYLTVGGTVAWRTYRTDVLYLFDEFDRYVDSVSVVGGVASRRFDEPGTYRYCVCIDPGDQGVIHVR